MWTRRKLRTLPNFCQTVEEEVQFTDGHTDLKIAI